MHNFPWAAIAITQNLCPSTCYILFNISSMHEQPTNYISLNKVGRPGCNAKSPPVQDMPGLILSCAGTRKCTVILVTRAWPKHGQDQQLVSKCKKSPGQVANSSNYSGWEGPFSFCPFHSANLNIYSLVVSSLATYVTTACNLHHSFPIQNINTSSCLVLEKIWGCLSTQKHVLVSGL